MAVAAAEACAGEEKAGLTFVIARSTCDQAIQLASRRGLLRLAPNDAMSRYGTRPTQAT